MKKSDFKEEQRVKMISWRGTNISSKEKGMHNKRPYDHVVPNQIWEETLWKGIKDELLGYLESNKIQPHSGKHNLLSSWICCANLYFPIRCNESLKQLMLDFLKLKISKQIESIIDIELEFAFSKGNALHPMNLLGEDDGIRGSGQTSPDVAFSVKTTKGEGYILTECKYTEHSFYPCSARRNKESEKRKKNPDSTRCMQPGNLCDYNSICHQNVWGRKYWKYLTLSETGKKSLTRCPASTAAYQLFRQQALAEGIALSGMFDLVASTVAFDERNNALTSSLASTGVNDFATNWSGLFEGKTVFKTWTHQEWVNYVRANQKNGEFSDWLAYLKDRYGY